MPQTLRLIPEEAISIFVHYKDSQQAVFREKPETLPIFLLHFFSLLSTDTWMINQIQYDSRHSRKLLKKQMPKDTKTTIMLLHFFFSLVPEVYKDFYHQRKEFRLLTFGGMLTNSSFPLPAVQQNSIISQGSFSPTLNFPFSKLQAAKFNFVFIFRSSELTVSTNFSVHRVNIINSNNCGTSYLHCLNTSQT